MTQNYAVNFYMMLNADDVFAQAKRTGTFFVPFPVDAAALLAYVESSQYPESVLPHWFKVLLPDFSR